MPLAPIGTRDGEQKEELLTSGPDGEPTWIAYQVHGDARKQPVPSDSVHVSVTGAPGATGLGEKLPAIDCAATAPPSSAGGRIVRRWTMASSITAVATG